MKLWEKFKSVANRALNNDGYEPSKTHIRIGDGSPVHSMGTTWLRSQWDVAVSASVMPTTLYYIAPQGWEIVYAALAFSGVLASILGKSYFSSRVDKFFNGKSINTGPDKTRNPTSPDDLLKVDRCFNANFASFLITGSTMSVLVAMPDLSVWAGLLPAFMVPAFFELEVYCGRMAYRLHNVQTGKWVIEDSPEVEEKEDFVSLPDPSQG